MLNENLIFVSDEDAAKLEKAGIAMEIRYVMPADTYNTLSSIFESSESDNSTPRKRRRRSRVPAFKQFEIPADYLNRAKLLRSGSLARRAAEALSRRPNPQKCERRKEVHEFLKTDLVATDAQVSNVIRYLATGGNVIHPLV